MPLQKRTVNVPLAKGASTKEHPFSLEIPQLAVAHNVHFPQPGAISKRPGWEALDGVVSPTRTLLTSGTDITAGTGFTTASISPTANNLVLAYVVTTDDASDPTVTGLAGCGLTWVSIASVSFNSSRSRLVVFRALGSPSPGVVTGTMGATVSSAAWVIEQWADVDTSGTNGSGAVAEIVTTSGTGVTALAPTLTGILPLNRASAAIGTDDAFGISFEAGWDTTASQTADNGAGQVANIKAVRKADGGDASAGSTFGSGSGADAAGAIVEVKAAVRNGYYTVGEGTLSGIQALWTRDEELVLAASGNIYTFAPQIGRWKDTASDLDACYVTSKVVADTPREQYFGDAARYTSGSQSLDCYAWEDYQGASGVNYQVVDTTTGRVLTSGRISTATRPRVLVVGTRFHIYHTYTGDNTLKAFLINADTLLTSKGATITTSTTAALITSTSPSHPYAVKSKTSSLSIIAMRSSATEYQIALIASDGSVSVGPTTKVLVAGDALPIDVAYSVASDRIAVIRVGAGPALEADLHNGATLATVFSGRDLDAAPGTVGNITSAFTEVDQGGGVYRCRVWYETVVTVTTASQRVIRHKTYHTDDSAGSGTGPSGTTNWAIHTALAAHAFVRGSKVYVTTVHRPNSNSVDALFTVPTGYTRVGSYTMYDHDGFPVADFLRLTGSKQQLSGVEHNSRHLPGVESLGDDTFRCVLVDRKFLAIANYGDRTLKDFRFDFDAWQGWRTAQLGRATYLSNGFYYDGASVVENNFLAPPHVPLGTPTRGNTGGAANSGLQDSKTYSYILTWGWVNDNGERERSTFETAFEIDTDAGGANANDCTLTFVDLYAFCATAKRSSLSRGDLSLEVWRTEADPGEGALYYLVTSLDPRSTGNNGYITNDTNTDFLADWTDAMPDATLITKPVLYVAQGELDNVPIGYHSVLAQGQGRLFAAGLEDPDQIRYSKIWAPSEAVAFNDSLTIQVPQGGGPITALVVEDQQIIVFKETQIYRVEGTGFSNVGSSGGFAEPQMCDSAVGCIDARSVVRWPGGILFQSHKGIYNFTGTQAVYIGAPVEDYALNEISGSLLLEDQHTVLFFLATQADPVNGELSDLTTISVLAYDYLLGQWATWNYPSNSVGHVVWDGDPVVAIDDGVVVAVLRQGSDVHLDRGLEITMNVITPWIKTDGMQGFGRLWWVGVLGDYQGPHLLRAKLGFDYSDTWTDSKTWTPTTDPYQVRISASKGIVTAFRVYLADEPTGSDVLEESADVVGLALEIGAIGGVARGSGSRSK